MRKVYSKLPNVKVESLYLTPDDLSSSRMLSLMAIDVSQTIPLYLSQALAVLEELGQDNFSLDAFREQLEPLQALWSDVQRDHFNQRMYLLNRVISQGSSVTQYFGPGKLVIIDVRG